MRRILGLMIVVAAGCSASSTTADHAPAKLDEKTLIQGRWAVFYNEEEGEGVVGAPTMHMIFDDDTVTFVAEIEHKIPPMKYTVNASTKPKQIDLYLKEVTKSTPDGKIIEKRSIPDKGVYEISDDILTICCAIREEMPRPESIKPDSRKGIRIYKLKRVK